MEAQQLDVPILFIIFNRPDVTKRVFDEIRKVRPKRLYVCADGPRANRPDDDENCRMTREVVTSHVDWPCRLETLFRKENQGCKRAVTSGIDWFFEQVEEGIILEDDDVPDPTFFRFCKELLEKYRNNQRVMTIEGTCVQGKNRAFKNPSSYYFSRIPMGWGWATWRRAWLLNDVDMKAWPELRASGALKDRFENLGAYERFSSVWDDYYAGKIDSYDGQFVFAFVANDGLSATPGRNLIANIGFGAAATHTRETDSEWADMPTHSMQFPLKHPEILTVDRAADAFLYRRFFRVDKKLRYRIVRPFKNTFPRTYRAIKRFLGRESILRE